MRPEHGTRAQEDCFPIRTLEIENLRPIAGAVARLNRVPAERGPVFRRFFAVRPNKGPRAGIVGELNLPAPVGAVDHIARLIRFVFQVGNRAAER